MAVADKCLQVERRIEGTVADALHLHRLIAHRVVREQAGVPCEHRIALRFQVFHQVAEGIDIVLATAAHLLLTGTQKVEHCRVVGKLGIDGQCLDEHSHGAAQSLVLTTVKHRREQRLLLVVELRQQQGIGLREQRALEDAVRLAEGIDRVDAYA